MPKVDKSQYTKDEWKRIKEQRRLEKLMQPSALVSQDNNYILCLKHGTKYGSNYVNTLYSMVERHCTVDYEFVCLTDDASGLNEKIKTISLPGGIEGWWCKPYMFSKDFPLNGNILYMDLDIVIGSSINKLFSYSSDKWCIIRDFTRSSRPDWKKYNSSVIRFKTGQLSNVWDDFLKNQQSIQKRLHGDQDWIYESTISNPAEYWPDNWIMSWKWEIRKSKEFAPGGSRGNRKLRNIENVVPPKDCCITVFHGDPNPHNCEDPWVIDNWR